MKIQNLLPTYSFTPMLNESEHEGEAVEGAPPVGQMGEYITTAQAARMLGFRNPSRVRQLIAEKKLKTHHPVPGRRDNFLKQSEVQDYKSRMREEEKKDADAKKKKTNESVVLENDNIPEFLTYTVKSLEDFKDLSHKAYGDDIRFNETRNGKIHLIVDETVVGTYDRREKDGYVNVPNTQKRFSDTTRSYSRSPTNEAAKPKHKVKTWAVGTEVSWHYRSAIGHGTIVGVHKLGTSHATTEYSIREHDHHKGEPAIVYHYGSALTRA